MKDENSKISRDTVKRKLFGAAVHQNMGWFVLGMMFAGDFGAKAVDLSDLALAYVSIRRSWEAASLLCHRKCMCEKKSGRQTAFTLSTVVFSHAYGAGQGTCHCVKAVWWKEQIAPYAHDNHGLHIKCFFFWSCPKEFASAPCASIFLLLWMKNHVMLFNLSQTCKWF